MELGMIRQNGKSEALNVEEEYPDSSNSKRQKREIELIDSQAKGNLRVILFRGVQITYTM